MSKKQKNAIPDECLDDESSGNSQFHCPVCKKELLRLPRTDGQYFWGCKGYEADGSGCDFTLNDKRGEPVFRPPVSVKHLCRSCGAGLQRRPAAKNKSFWWGCSAYPRCRQNYPDTCDESGQPAPDYTRGWQKQ